MTIPLVRVRYLKAYSEACERLGGDAKRLLHKARLAPELLPRVDELIPLQRMGHFVELALREVGPALSSAAAPRRLTELGRFGQYLASAPTLQDAFVRLSRAARTEAAGAEFSVRRQRGATWLLSTSTFACNEVLRAHVERYLVDGMLALVRHWLGDGWRPEELWLQSELQTEEMRFAAVRRLRYRAPAVAFPVYAHDSVPANTEPPTGANPPTSIDEIPLDDLGFVPSLERVITTYLPLGQVSLREISERVGMNARKLQRRLDTERATYSRVLDGLRQRIALDRLRTTNAPITEIAHDLGYADSAHFARAFRRWAGTSPLALRRQQHDRRSARASERR